MRLACVPGGLSHSAGVQAVVKGGCKTESVQCDLDFHWNEDLQESLR